MKKYELYWRNLNIGSLTETNWDMRSSGCILFKFKFLSDPAEYVLLAEYIKHSIKASNYLEEGDEDNYTRMCVEEEKFLPIINSTEWWLTNDKEETVRILCPIFHDNNEVTWQINLHS